MIVIDQNEGLGRWLCAIQKTQYAKDESAVYIGSERKGKLNAVAMYNNYMANGSICMHLSIKGMISKDALHFAFCYPFIQLGIKKIIAPIESTNERCLKFAYNAGFTHEHTIKDAGNNCDLVILSMTKEQCRFLR